MVEGVPIRVHYDKRSVGRGTINRITDEIIIIRDDPWDDGRYTIIPWARIRKIVVNP